MYHISILGTGLMGSALARALCQAAYPVTVWNRTRSRAEPLTEVGAQVVDTVAQAVQASEVIIVNVSDYAVTEGLLRAPEVAALLTGKTVIELTSGSPRQARDAAAWVAAQGADYLDGAILATPDLIGCSAATIIESGPATLSQRLAEMLGTLAAVHHVGDDPGQANAMDAAGLSLMWGALFGGLHAIAVCEAEGVPLQALAAQLDGAQEVIQGMLRDMVQRTDAGRFSADAETLSTVGTSAGAMNHLIEVMTERNLDRAVVDGYQALFAKAERAGQLNDDFAAMTQHLHADS